MAKKVNKPDGLTLLEYARLSEWFAEYLRTGKIAKPAHLAFTAGAARDAGAAFECAVAKVKSQAKNRDTDSRRMDWLESQGVQSIYFNNGGQMNPASMSLRAAIDIDHRP
jgi:hypothetical protein